MTALCAISRISAGTAQRSVDRSLLQQAHYGGTAASIDLEWACLGATTAGEAPEPLARMGRLAIAADCRLHHRDKLLGWLADAGRRDMSDAELILALWNREGPASVARLSGSFAFILVDEESRSLHLVRDLAGSRPLFFADSKPGLACASTPMGLSEFISGRADIDYMAARMGGRSWRGDRTQWEGVRIVPPASIVAISPHGQSCIRHFEPLGRPLGSVDADSPEAFRELIDRAVDSSLQGAGDVVATHLSSGLDSSAVTTSAAASRARPDRLIAYTAAPLPGFPKRVPRGSLADESGAAAETAWLAQVEHIVVRDGSRMIDSIRGMAVYFQDSSPNPFNHGWWTAINRDARERGARILLTAFFGNPTVSFGGLPALAYHLAQARFGRWLTEARAAHRRNELRWRGIVFASLEPFLPGIVSEQLRRWGQGFAPIRQASFVRREALERIERDSVPWAIRSGDPRVERANLLWWNDTGLRNAGMEAFTGIQEREPLIDRELVEFCFGLPPQAMIADGRFKPLLKDALSGRVPDSVLDQSLRGVQGTDWTGRIDRHDAQEMLEEISASSQAGELIDLARLRAAIDRWPEPGEESDGALFSYGRYVTDALADGLFLAEIERYPPES